MMVVVAHEMGACGMVIIIMVMMTLVPSYYKREEGVILVESPYILLLNRHNAR